MNKIFVLIACLFLLPISTAHAELKLSLDRGQVEPLPIAIPIFYGEGVEASDAGIKISDKITENLKSSGLVNVLNRFSYLQKPESLAQDGPRFSEWSSIGSQALVTGVVKRKSDGDLRVEFRLWDTLGQSQMVGTAYTTKPDNWRRIAHIISDVIFERLTGEGGYFDSRIVYISETGPANKRIKRLAIMDQDGYNHKFLTDGSFLVLTPRFSPANQEITYMAYVKNKPRVYLYNIDTGRQEILGDFPGMTFAPRFSPDGNKVIMSLALNGNTDIYTMDLRSRKVTQLTNHPSIDTSPSYAPDGRRIVFESDRGGSQQLYVMDQNGGSPQRITFGDGRYANPVWSPRGDLIAFTRMYKGKFYIGVIRPDGSGQRLIATAYHVEGPSWAPNGRYLTYFKEKPRGNSRSAKLYKIDLTGYNESQIPTPLDGPDPAWSPLN